MKRTFITFCLSAAMVLALAGCAGNGTADGQPGGQLPMNSASPSPSTTPEVHNNGTDDLAGADGIVGDDDAGLPDAGATDGTDGAADDENGAAGRSRNSALDGVGRGIMDSMEDLGEGARNAIDDMGRGARSAMDHMGDAARQAGQHVKESIN